MPDAFLTLKLLHLMAVILMVGATVINGLLHAEAKKHPPDKALPLLQAVLKINRLLMGPALILIPATGIAMAVIARYDLTAPWLGLSLVLSVALILAYVKGLRLERALAAIAAKAIAQGDARLPPVYAATFLKAAPIGGGALVASVAAMILMIFQPM